MSSKKNKRLSSSERIPANDNLSENIDSIYKTTGRHRIGSIIILSAIIIIVMVLVLFVGFAFSWFAPKQAANMSILVSSSEAEVQYIIDKEGVDEQYSSLKGSENDISFAVDDIDDIVLSVKFIGPSSAYIRVQLFESFKTSSGNMYPTADLEYKLAKGWEKIGDYYYYKDIVTNPNKDRAPIYIPFLEVDSCSYSSATHNGVYMNLVAITEAVQPDRFEDFFGADPDVLFGNNIE